MINAESVSKVSQSAHRCRKASESAGGPKNCATLFGPHTALFRECSVRAALVVVECYLADNTARERPKPKRFEAGKLWRPKFKGADVGLLTGVGTDEKPQDAGGDRYGCWR